MPSSTLEDLAESYGRVSAANQRTLDRFLDIGTQLRSAGIDFLVLKGADLVTRVYGMMGTRPMVDVDLLIRGRDLDAVDRLLTTAGYRQEIDGNPAYRSPDGALLLDITTGLWYLRPDEFDAPWRRAVPRTLNGLRVLVMGTEDLILYLSAYAVLHRGSCSRVFLKDLHLLLQKESVDWARVVRTARQYHLTIPLFHALSSVRAGQVGLTALDRVLAELAPRTMLERGFLFILRRLVTDPPLEEIGHVLMLLTQRSAPTTTWLAQRLLPSRAFLAYRYGASAARRPIRTRLTRLVQLLSKAGILLGRIALALVRSSNQTADRTPRIQPLIIRPSEGWFVSPHLPNKDRLTILQRTPLRVASWSMFPTIHKGDLLEVRAPDHLAVGDIVVYCHGSVLVCHRVKTLCSDGSLFTGGDAGQNAAERIEQSQVLAKVVAVVRGRTRLPVSHSTGQSALVLLRYMTDHWISRGREQLRRGLGTVARRLGRHAASQRALFTVLRRCFTAHVTVSGPIGTVPTERVLLITQFPLREAELELLRNAVDPDQEVKVQVRCRHLLLGSLYIKTGEQTLHPLAEGLGFERLFDQLLSRWRVRF